MRIGQMIKNYRAEHGLSMRAFANLSGISPSYVSKLESDTQNKLSLTLCFNDLNSFHFGNCSPLCHFVWSIKNGR